MKRVLLVMVLVLLGGCAVTKPGTENRPFSVTQPPGWKEQRTNALMLVSKEYPALQNVEIARKGLQEEKQFSHTKRRVTAEMLPQELAEVVIDEFQSDQNFPVEAVEENEPAVIGGDPGFRVRLTYSTKSGLKYRTEIYGFVHDNWYYQITYSAPARYYFARDLPAVQEMVKSFTLSKTQ
jgi:hypothetical protein